MGVKEGDAIGAKATTNRDEEGEWVYLRKAGWSSRLALGAVSVAAMGVGWWMYPVTVAEERGLQRVRGVTVMTYCAVVCPVLWVGALVWAGLGRRGREGG